MAEKIERRFLCDRCGKEVPAMQLHRLELQENFLVLTKCTWLHSSRYDLCEACMLTFKSFIGGAKG